MLIGTAHKDYKSSDTTSLKEKSSSLSFRFHILPEALASSKKISHAEKLLGAYLYTLCKHRKKFRGRDELMAKKVNLTLEQVQKGLVNLTNLGLIQCSTDVNGKREITLGAMTFSPIFYKLYFTIAETQLLDAEEKILLTYILSFHDNAKPFYAKNGIVLDLLNITKEGFTRCKKHFEKLGWIQVLYPKTPRRQLVIISHPCEGIMKLSQKQSPEH